MTMPYQKYSDVTSALGDVDMKAVIATRRPAPGKGRAAIAAAKEAAEQEQAQAAADQTKGKH